MPNYIRMRLLGPVVPEKLWTQACARQVAEHGFYRRESEGPLDAGNGSDRRVTTAGLQPNPLGLGDSRLRGGLACRPTALVPELANTTRKHLGEGVVARVLVHI
jgi:hypothetical protein